MEAVELEQIVQRLPRTGSDDATHQHKDTETLTISRTENAVEMNTAVSVSNAPSGSPPSGKLPLRAHVMYGTLLGTMFLAGWNDATTGPLLPRIQLVYNIGFAIVSLLFVFNFLGFATASAVNVWITDRFGFGKVVVIGESLLSFQQFPTNAVTGAISQTIGYVLSAPAPPFPVFVLGYFFSGFGISLQLSAANGFVAGFRENVSTKLGLLHASYGAGALTSPLVATVFSQHSHWSFHFLVSLGLSIVNLTMLASSFRLRTQPACLTEIGIPPSPDNRDNDRSSSKYKQIMRLREVHFMALFILIYVGTEVTLGGWIVTYVIDLRGGGPSSGYISSGFFGGLMVGRILLLGVNKLVGERRAMFLYGFLAIGLEIVVWFVPSLVGGAVAVSGVGLLLGPMYPLVMNHARRVLPPWLLTGSIGWIAGFGQAGSACLPFVTGMLASKVGIKVMQPLVVSMMSVMVATWAFVPSTRRLE